MQPTQLTCRACGKNFTGNYCNNCGEKYYTEADRKVSHFLEEGLHFITHFEGKFFKTVRTIFTKPGKLSEDYCAGIRKPYFKPLSLFLLLVVVYLLFPKFEGLNQRLQYHQTSLYGTYAKAKVAELEKKYHPEDVELAFRAKSEKTSKFLLVIIIPLTALCFWALTYRRRKYFFDQMVFSTEINNFMLLWGFMLVPLLITIAGLISNTLTGGDSISIPDGVISFLMVFVMAVYIVFAARRFYQIKTWKAILFSLGYFIINFIVVQFIYKFILFAIVINQID